MIHVSATCKHYDVDSYDGEFQSRCQDSCERDQRMFETIAGEFAKFQSRCQDSCERDPPKGLGRCQLSYFSPVATYIPQVETGQ